VENQVDAKIKEREKAETGMRRLAIDGYHLSKMQQQEYQTSRKTNEDQVRESEKKVPMRKLRLRMVRRKTPRISSRTVSYSPPKIVWSFLYRTSAPTYLS